MPHLDACLGILRRLIAKGDPDQLSQTERAVDEYWDATRPGARKSGLWFIQQDDLVQATRAPTSEDDVPFALFALERMMFIRAFDKACWDLSAGAIIGSIHLLRWPAGRAGGRRCRLVGLGQDHRDLPATDGHRGGPFAGLTSRRDLPSTIGHQRWAGCPVRCASVRSSSMVTAQVAASNCLSGERRNPVKGARRGLKRCTNSPR
jgi:hypothetical protein